MKKLLLLFTIISTSFTINAQSVTLTTFDASLEQGATGNISIDYVSTVDGATITYQLNAWDGSSINYGDQPYYGTSTIATAGSGSLSLPFTLGAATIGNNNYIWSIKLTDDGTDYYDNDSGNVISITAPAVVVNSAAFSGVLPTTVAQGETVSITYDYSLVAAGQAKVAIVEWTTAWSWITTVAEVIEPLVATTVPGETTEVTTNIVVDVAAPLSSAISPNIYRIYLSLQDTGGTSLVGDSHSSAISLTAPLGLDDFNVEGIAIYPSPVSDRLMINTNRLQAKTITLNDIMGRTVKIINNAQNTTSIDVSSLSKGMYILTTDTNKQFKFLKK